MATLRPWTDDEARKFYSGTATYERTVAAPPAMLRAGQRVFLNFGEGTVVDPALGAARAFRHAGVAGESGARSGAGLRQRQARRARCGRRPTKWRSPAC